MLRTGLTHPEILAALAAAGHGSQVLIADANYPASTASAAGAARVHLNLAPGQIGAVPVLQALLGAVVVEEALVMRPDPDGSYARSGDPAIWAAYRDALAAAGSDVALGPRERLEFYELARGRDVALVVVTGELEWYANVLVRIGPVPTEGGSGRAD